MPRHYPSIKEGWSVPSTPATTTATRVGPMHISKPIKTVPNSFGLGNSCPGLFPPPTPHLFHCNRIPLRHPNSEQGKRISESKKRQNGEKRYDTRAAESYRIIVKGIILSTCPTEAGLWSTQLAN